MKKSCDYHYKIKWLVSSSFSWFCPDINFFPCNFLLAVQVGICCSERLLVWSNYVNASVGTRGSNTVLYSYRSYSKIEVHLRNYFESFHFHIEFFGLNVWTFNFNYNLNTTRTSRIVVRGEFIGWRTVNYI